MVVVARGEFGERIALDTNVLSEIMRKEPDENVVGFVAQLDDPLVGAAVFHEPAYGVARLPEGAKDFEHLGIDLVNPWIRRIS